MSDATKGFIKAMKESQEKKDIERRNKELEEQVEQFLYYKIESLQEENGKLRSDKDKLLNALNLIVDDGLNQRIPLTRVEAEEYFEGDINLIHQMGGSE